MRHSINTVEFSFVAFVIAKQIVHIVDDQKSGRANTTMLAAVVIYLFLVDVIFEISECNPTLFDKSIWHGDHQTAERTLFAL